MKKVVITLLLPLCALATQAQTPKKTVTTKKTTTVKKAGTAKATTPVFKSGLDSASYSFGIAMASSMKKDGLNALNYNLLVRGLQDAFNNKTSLISKEKSQIAISNLFNNISKQKSEANKLKFAPNINAGKTFLENNKSKAGIQVTPSGLQYEVLARGTGARPAATDTVTVHYRGTLLNGNEFDSSYKRNEPLTLPLNRVITGWTEGMQLMQAGSKYRFYIPYNLAYGENGAGEDIPPYSTLIFEVELLKINGK